MKLQILAFIGAVALPVGAEAATIAIGSGFGAAQGIIAQTSSGASLSAGGYYIGVGTFDAVPTIGSPTDLLAAVTTSFKEFGNATSPTAVGATQGKIAASITSIPATPADFNTKELYIVVGNAATKAASTEFAILRGTPTFNFPADTAAAGGTTYNMVSAISFAPVAGAGTEVDNATGVDGVQLAAIPEPSAALLAAAVGVLGLARRRR